MSAEATRTPELVRAQVACVSCARSVRSFTGRYRDLLRDPGTVFTVVAFVLLVLGGIQHPSGLLGSDRSAEVRTPFYIAAALVGSAYIWWSVAIGELDVGDLVLVRSGERIAVDGEVLAGSASINQSAISGESAPVDMTVGDDVYAGTLNELGAIEVLAAKVGTETTLGQIRHMVEEAQTQKAPIERLLNRCAKLYTPAALLLGAGVWFFTGDILRAITILIVFCPCVMVLATPTALVASIGNAALRGSLVKKGATIEALARIDTIAFDKTGTLTTGAPVLVEARPLNGMVDSELLRMAATAERFSEHPVGRAIVAYAEEKGLAVADPERFEVLPGLGVRAGVAGRDMLLGRPKLLVEEGLTVPPSVVSEASKLAILGRTVILGSVDGIVEGLLVLEDAFRPEARQLTHRLARLGIKVVLVTGDNQSTARRIANELGIAEVHAEVLPAEKVGVVKRLQAQGQRVAFVGDGVNDGPALATADVGVAMGLGGTDVAIETAEIALLSDDLSKLPHLLELSQQAIRAIKQNLVFSLGVLGVAVGLAIPGILHPVTGALLHELSSLPVIANSARLIGLREKTS